LVGVWAHLGEPIWWHQPWSRPLLTGAHDVIGFALAGLVLARFVRPEPAVAETLAGSLPRGAAGAPRRVAPACSGRLGGVGGAPEVPARHAPPRPPALAVGEEGGRAREAVAAVEDGEPPAHPQIRHRQHVRAPQVEDEQHLDGPRPDATH